MTTAPAGQVPTQVRYVVLAVACSLAVLTYVQRQGFVAATPYVKEQLQLSDEQMGYLGAVWLIAYGLFQMPGGLLGDRFGARHLLTFLVLGWSLTVAATGLIAFLPPGGWVPFACLIALQFLFAMFQAGGFPVLSRVIADWMPMQQRGFAQGTMWTFSRLGGFLAFPFTVWLIVQVFDRRWSIPLALLGNLGVIWCAFFWLWFRNRPAEMPTVNVAERELIAAGQPPATVARGPIPWSAFLTSRNVWALSLMYGFVGFAGNFITRMLGLYLRDHRKISDDTAAWLTGLPLAFGIISCLTGGVVSDWLIRRLGSRKWGRRLVGCTVLTCAGLSCLLPIIADEVWLLALAFSAWFFFSDATMGPAWASCTDVGERYAGTLSGAMNMTGAFFGAVGVAFAGRCLHQQNYTVMFLIFAASYALAALCWLFVDVTKPLVPSSQGR